MKKNHMTKLTIKQKRMITHHMITNGIKGGKMNWEGLDISTASVVIGNLVKGELRLAIKDLEDNGFTFTEDDKSFK